MTSRSLSFGQFAQRAALVAALTASAWNLAQAATPEAGNTTPQATQPGTTAPGQPADPAARDKSSGAASDAAFTRADANADGKLSREEAGRLPAISAKFNDLDKNKDGVLTAAEFAVGYSAAP